jgi:hypothetical protein
VRHARQSGEPLVVEASTLRGTPAANETFERPTVEAVTSWFRRNMPNGYLPSVIAAGGLGPALLLGGDAEAQDMEGLEPLPEGVNLREEGEWQGSWFRTQLPDGSGGIARVIRGPDGAEYTIVGRQSDDLSIQVLGVRPVGPNPPGQPSPRVGEFGPQPGDLPTDAYGWTEPMPDVVEDARQPFSPEIRAIASIGTGLLSRGIANRAGPIVRGFATGAGAGFGNVVTGGDPLESLAYAGLTPFAASGAERFIVQPALRGVDNITLPMRPEFRAQRDAFAARLGPQAPVERAMSGYGEIPMGAGGLQLEVPRGEVLDQGFARNIDSGTPSPRDMFLDSEPTDQQAWMISQARINDRLGRDLPPTPDRGQIGFASGVDPNANRRGLPQPPPPPPPRGMPPMNRRTRAERTEQNVRSRASTRPAGPTLDGFFEAAAREGVVITPENRTVAAKVRAFVQAMRDNPQLEQLARDWGLVTLLTAGSVSAATREDPLEQISQ